MSKPSRAAPATKRAVVRTPLGDPQLGLVLERKPWVLSLLLAEWRALRTRVGSAVGNAYASAAGSFLHRLERIEDANAERRFRRRSKALPPEVASVERSESRSTTPLLPAE